MAIFPQPFFDHVTTLEELAGVGKNRRFDEIIDDEESSDKNPISLDTVWNLCKTTSYK